MSYCDDSENHIREVKVCFLGDADVGKSSLVLRYVSDIFEPNPPMTIGTSSMSKTISIGDEIIKFDIWDTAGQERFRTLTPVYYRRAEAAIIVYDITSRISFNYVKNWVDDLKQHAPKCNVIALVGNKCDLEERREVPRDVGEGFSKEINAIFIETSALIPQNVNEIFNRIGRALVPPSPQAAHAERLNLNRPARRGRQSSCC